MHEPVVGVFVIQPGREEKVDGGLNNRYDKVSRKFQLNLEWKREFLKLSLAEYGRSVRVSRVDSRRA